MVHMGSGGAGIHGVPGPFHSCIGPFHNEVCSTCAEQLLQVCVELLGGRRLQVQRYWLQLNLP